MTREYIGARYVPKFYTNSVDGSAAWESNVVYEPLTYVTLTNGHMYISKKEVPATIGTPASNIQYWLDCGSYNGFIDDLQQQINALVTDVNAKANMTSIAPVENGDDTVGSYSAGDEFYRNGVLYKAKTTIAANTAFSSLVLNTDYEAAPTVTSQIETLTGDISDMKDGTVSGSLQYQINDINDKIALTTGRKIIFVGDSYGNNPNNNYQYPDVCASVMGLTSSKYVNACVSGAGFTKTGNLSYLHQLEAITTNRDTYTDIVVLGGTNDASDASSVFTALRDFMAYAKTNFPNAKVWVGCLTWQYTYNNNDDVLQNIVDQYENAAQFGASIIKDAWLIIHRYDYLRSDRVHPNDDGSKIIGRALASKLRGGDFEASANVALFGTLTSSIGTWSNSQLKECPSDKNIMIVFSHEFEFTSATNITPSTSVTLGDVSGGCVYGGTKTPWLVTDAIINDTTAAKIRLTIAQGHILVRALTTTISSVSKITIIGALSMPAVCG